MRDYSVQSSALKLVRFIPSHRISGTSEKHRALVIKFLAFPPRRCLNGLPAEDVREKIQVALFLVGNQKPNQE